MTDLGCEEIVVLDTTPDITQLEGPTESLEIQDTSIVLLEGPESTAVLSVIDGDVTIVEEPSTEEVRLNVTNPSVTILEEPTDETLIIVAGAPGPAGKAGVIKATSDTLLSGHRAIVIDNGVARYADPTDLGDVWRPLHLTMGAMSPGVETDVLALGEIEEAGWSWAPGVPLYVGLNGVLQATEPVGQVWTRIVALTNDATSIYFNPNDPIVVA